MKLFTGSRGRIARAAAWALAGATIVAAFAARQPAGRAESGAPGEGGPPVAVEVLVVREDAVGAELVLPARVEARSEIALAARFAGRVTRLAVREGESFRAGQTLAEFNAPEATSVLRAARARLDAATVGATRAARQEARHESLFARGVVAARELEIAEEAARAAAAERSAAGAELARWATGTRLAAPFDGVVVRRRVDAGADVAAGQPVLDLRSHDGGEIAADLPESALGSLAGARVAVQIGDGPWRPARLARVEGMIDAASRTRRAYFTPLPDERGSMFEPGAFARVRIDGTGGEARAGGGDAASASGAFIVPSRSLVRRGGLSGVFVVAGDRARLRWVRPGRVRGDGVEIAAGLLAGDAVVVEPGALADGQTVRVRP